MTTPSLQPLTLTSPPEELRAHFVKIAWRENPDPLWHFELAVAKSSRAAPAACQVPQPGGDLVSLALFNRPDPPCDVEIYGLHLTHELDPADWLDAWSETQPFQVLSRLRVPTLGGAVGDLVIRWETAESAWMGRLVAMKAGPRLVMLWFRTTAADYPRLAEGMFLTLSTFRMLDESPGPLAEQVRRAQAPLPIPWRTVIPVSWELKLEPATERVGSFQATLLAPGAGANAPSTMLGKLSFAVIAAGQASGHTEVFEQMRGALTDTGTTVEPMAPVAEPASSPWLEDWRTQTAAVVNGVPAEVHGRVLRHAQIWVAALVLTPRHTEARDLWMRNKRVLDIATATLQLPAANP